MPWNNQSGGGSPWGQAASVAAVVAGRAPGAADSSSGPEDLLRRGQTSCAASCRAASVRRGHYPDPAAGVAVRLASGFTRFNPDGRRGSRSASAPGTAPPSRAQHLPSPIESVLTSR